MKHWRELTLREQIGQTVCLHDMKLEMECKQGSPASFLEQYPVGAMFVGGQVINDQAPEYDVVRDAVLRYREHSQTPLLIVSDTEAGAGLMVQGLTCFPPLMALGAINDLDLAYEYGRITAQESLSVGINWSFAPVADLNVNFLNPITNVRSVGDDPNRAIPILKNVIRGMQDHGLAAAAKHFPGDGTDYRDQHLTTTRNRLSFEQWKTMHGRVFQELIDDGVLSIMTGHITLPAYQTPDADGLFIPATLSAELSTKLLKEEMGFQGVVVSDALLMGGFLGWHENQTKAELESFKAGSDILLWPTLHYFDAMEEAIQKEEVPESRLHDALDRIWRMKERSGLFGDPPTECQPLPKETLEKNQNLATTLSERSLVLVRNRRKLLPVAPTNIRKVLLAPICPHEQTLSDIEEAMKIAFEERGATVELLRKVWVGDMEQKAKGMDLILYVLSRIPHRPVGSLDLSGDQLGALWASLCTGREQSVVVTFGNPYYVNQYFERANCVINAHSTTKESVLAVVKAIYGEIEMTGTSPVDLDNNPVW